MKSACLFVSLLAATNLVSIHVAVCKAADNTETQVRKFAAGDETKAKAAEEAKAHVAGIFDAPVAKQPGPGASTVTLDLPQLGERELQVKVKPEKPEQQTLLTLAQVGDMATVTVDDATNPTTVTEIKQITRSASPWVRFGVMVFGLVLIVFAAAVVTRWDPRQFLIGKDKRYSNSQVQLALWFTTVATAYGAAVILRLRWDGGFVGGVDVPSNLLTLTGLSGLSFGGAKVITAQKVAAAKDKADAEAKAAAEAKDAAEAKSAAEAKAADDAKTAAAAASPSDKPAAEAKAADAAKTAYEAKELTKAKAADADKAGKKAKAEPKPDGVPNFWKDLVQNDKGEADLGDFQMILVTVAAVVVYGLSIFHFLGALPISTVISLPDVDTTLLSGFGVGQGAYLIKKAALNPGDG
jgi:hypothetical protein